jgi:hypothetical protein
MYFHPETNPPTLEAPSSSVEVLPEVKLWRAALKLYVTDLLDHQKGLTKGTERYSADRGQAWRDFKSEDRPMLSNLCDRTGFDIDYTVRKINEQMRARWA